MTIKHLFPPAWPTLDLNFAATRELDPRITFTRASTGTYVDRRGIVQTAVDDEPRFDHSGAGESLGLLIEQSRTNYVTDNDQVMMDQGNCTPTQTTGPDGVSTSASRLTAIASGSTVASNGTNRTITWSADVITTWSFYFNPANTTATTVSSGAAAGSGVGGATFEWSTLTATPDPSKPVVIDAGIVYVGNGWYKAWTIYDNTISSSVNYRSSVIFTAVAAGESIDVFGQMVEEGSFPTSYIPTAGATATRAADICNITGTDFSSWYNQSNGTIYAKFAGQTYATGTASRILSFADDDTTSMSAGNGILFGSHTGGPDTQRWRVRGPSTANFSLATEPVVSTALAYATSDLAMVFDGGTVESSTNSPPTALDRLNIFPANVPICRLSYYPRRLTDEQLEALTS